MIRKKGWLAGFVLSLALILGLAAIPVLADLGGDKPDLYGSPAPAVDEVMPGEILVGFEPGTPRKELARLARSLGAELGGVNRPINVALFTVKDVPRTQEVMEALKQAPGVTYVELNGIVRLPDPVKSELPVKEANGDAEAEKVWSDPMASYQWHFVKILDIWAPQQTSAPTIAVVDTGVDYTHQDLAGKVIKGKDFFFMDNDPMDDYGHGTHVAGIAAAWSGNGKYGAGVSPKSKVLAVKVLGPEGWGSWWMVAKGITYAANRLTTPRVKVINLSLGGSSPSTTLQNAVNYAYKRGKVVVASAGNHNYYTNQYPAAYTATVSVAAIEQEGCRTYFSAYNWKTYKTIDIAAPGYHIPSTLPGNQTANWSGTSMSAPMVSGAAARVFAKYGMSRSPAWVKARLKNYADATTCGFPIAMKELNLFRALGGSATGFRGMVYDGVSGQPLKGAKVQVYKGTTLKKTTYTKGSGMWAVRGLVGGVIYRVKVSKSGYVPLVKRYRARGGKVWETVKHFLAPVRAKGEVTVVVDWKSSQPISGAYNSANPGGFELDAWLRHPTAGYIYWGSPGALGTPPWAQFMRDSYNDLVHAEAHVIRKVQSGVYKYGINRSSTYGWGNLGKSGATVRVYRGSNLVRTFKVPRLACSGKSWWYVFKLKGTTITKVNTCGNTTPF